MGAKIVDIELKSNKYAIASYYIITPSEISANLARLDGIRYGYSLQYNPKGKSAENVNEIYLRNRGESFGNEVKRRIMLGTYALSSGYYDAYYKKAMSVKEQIKKEFKSIFNQVDAILGPTSPHIAFKIGEQFNDPLKMYLEDVFSIAPSLGGLPAMSIPVGFSQKMPFGMQISAQRFNDETVLNLAHNFQKETDFHTKFPSF